jgi:pilus assembly protein CpaB
MTRKPVGLAVAFVLALLGTLLLVGYVQAARTKVGASERLLPVLVVDKPIAKGTEATLAATAVKVVNVPESVRAKDALAELNSMKGKLTTADLVPGEQLLASRFATPAQVAEAEAGPGNVEVTITLGPDRAVGGQIKVGDTVDILASFKGGEEGGSTHLFMSNVKITAVQTKAAAAPQANAQAQGQAQAQNGQPTPAPRDSFLVTFAVSPPDAERLVYAAENASLWLAANGTVPTEGIRVVTRKDLF